MRNDEEPDVRDTNPHQRIPKKAFHSTLSVGDCRSPPGEPCRPQASAGDLLAKSTVLNRYGRAANYLVPAALGLLAVAAVATLSMLAGCTARRTDTSSKRDPEKDPHRSQSAACLSSKAKTTGECSTEGGGLGTDDRASGIACGQSRGGDTGAGGTASKPESTGTGKAARDRRGLADAWPEVRPSSCISPVPGSPVTSVAGAG